MNGGYVAIASILLYFLLLQTLDAPTMNPKKAAIIFVVGSFATTAVVMALENAARGIPVLANIFTLQGIITAVVQFFAAGFIFYKAEQTNDEYLSFVFWGGFGLALIFYVIPMVLQRLFTLL